MTPWISRAELARKEAELVDARRRLDAERLSILTTISHELRTPLTIVQGGVSALAHHWDRLSETERLDLIDSIVANVASLDASILHFIDAGRLERGDVTVVAEWVELGAAVGDVTAKLAPVLAGHDLRLQLDVDTVWADGVAFRRVLECLLSNAARFSGIGAPIHVHASRAGGSVEVAVVDRGIGVLPAHARRVFEPFWRGETGATGVGRGAGLGLAIVDQLVRRHGGEVSLQSSRGRGSTFRVTFPDPPDRAPRRLSASWPASRRTPAPGPVFPPAGAPG